MWCCQLPEICANSNSRHTQAGIKLANQNGWSSDGTTLDKFENAFTNELKLDGATKTGLRGISQGWHLFPSLFHRVPEKFDVFHWSGFGTTQWIQVQCCQADLQQQGWCPLEGAAANLNNVVVFYLAFSTGQDAILATKERNMCNNKGTRTLLGVGHHSISAGHIGTSIQINKHWTPDNLELAPQFHSHRLWFGRNCSIECRWIGIKSLPSEQIQTKQMAWHPWWCLLNGQWLFSPRRNANQQCVKPGGHECRITSQVCFFHNDMNTVLFVFAFFHVPHWVQSKCQQFLHGSCGSANSFTVWKIPQKSDQANRTMLPFFGVQHRV